jgi:hypothetical protein
MEPATAQPPDIHPGTGTPSQPHRYPHEPEHPVRDLPDTATASGYTSTFCGRAEQAARVRREMHWTTTCEPRRQSRCRP